MGLNESWQGGPGPRRADPSSAGLLDEQTDVFSARLGADEGVIVFAVRQSRLSARLRPVEPNMSARLQVELHAAPGGSGSAGTLIQVSPHPSGRVQVLGQTSGPVGSNTCGIFLRSHP